MLFPQLMKGRKVLRGDLRNGSIQWNEYPAEFFAKDHFNIPDDGKFRPRRSRFEMGAVQQAGLQFTVPFTTVALTASTAKTVAGIKTPTNQCVKILEAAFGFDGATSTNAAVICEMGSCTFATNGPGTNSTSVTPAKQDTGRAETIQSTCGKTWTTEPTVITVNKVIDIPQYNGFVVLPLAQYFSNLLIVGGNGFVVRLTSPNNVNVSGWLLAEE